MENISDFDLNTALRLWLERLGQSPQFRTENLGELESHVRDSVGVLQSKGLSTEEAFLIGIRRVGNTAALEPEFAKENGGRGWLHGFRRMVFKYGNKVLHALILIFFSIVCWFVWGTLHLPQMMQGAMARTGAIDQSGYGALPGFTIMMMALRNFVFIPPLLAFAYCLYVWFRKSDERKSWTGFLAVTTALLIFIVLPTLIAVLLPVIGFINSLPREVFQH